MKSLLRILFLLVVGVFVLSAVPAALAVIILEPTYATADVDGSSGEWDLTEDFIAEMRQAGMAEKDVKSNFYMRYDCDTQTAYVLVLLVAGEEIHIKAEEHWVKVDGPKVVDDTAGDDGTAPDFAFVEGSAPYVGWEASFPLAPGTYDFDVHTLYVDDETSANVDPVSITIDCLGSIGDYVWYDEDGEGDQDELPANGLPNITVRLFEETAPNVLTLVDTQITDADGFYLFTGLPAGDYVVDVHNPDIAAAFPLGYVSTTNNDPYPYSLSHGEDYLDADFGYDDLGDFVALGDWIWYDEDGEGDQDEGEEYGIPCVTVWLYDKDDIQIGQTNTDTWGNYYFGGMSPSTLYSTTVDVTDPDIDNFIEAFNGGPDPATCSTVPEQLNQSSPLLGIDSFGPQEADPTGPTTLGTVNLNTPGTTDPTLDFSFTAGPLAISLADFTADSAAAPWLLLVVIFLTMTAGTGLWLARRRAAEL